MSAVNLAALVDRHRQRGDRRGDEGPCLVASKADVAIAAAPRAGDAADPLARRATDAKGWIKLGFRDLDLELGCIDGVQRRLHGRVLVEGEGDRSLEGPGDEPVDRAP